MPFSSAPLPSGASSRIEIALLMQPEVLLSGMSALLHSIPYATGVALGDVPSTWAEPVTAPVVRVVIATLARWRQLGENPLMVRPGRPLVLIVDSKVDSSDISFPDAPPLDGVVSFDGLTTSVLDAVLQRVIAGEMPMPPELARRLIVASRDRLYRSGGRTVTLTAREQETLSLLAQGFSNKQIAKALGISGHGVKRLVGAVLMKLGAPNRTTAVITAINEGLV